MFKQYGLYIWSAYGLMIIVFMANVFNVWRQRRRLLKKLKAKYASQT